MMEYKWTLLEADAGKTESLRLSLKATRAFLCKIFVQRGLDTLEKTKDFFNPGLELLLDPFRIKDMEIAVTRIIKAISNQEKILLYGDYDVDGTTAVALIYQYLIQLTNQENISYYIPDRQTEGYGLSQKGIDFANEGAFGLIITLDCGITATKLVEQAPPSIDFIICDHHIPGEKLPDAVAILNPKQKDCNYPFKELCGCGIAFKLISAINQTLKKPEALCNQFLDLVALAIGADIVTMTGENRILCYHGLEKLNKNPLTGLRALMEVSGLGYYDNYKSVFQLAPRINAAGRMDHGRLAVQLLIGNDYEKALQLAKVLNEYNEERKSHQTQITTEAIELVNQNLGDHNTSVVHKKGWHKGVLGIVASKLIESQYRPTIVLTTQDGSITGSGRSVRGFNLYEALFECKEHLVQFGGHTAAAGLTMLPEKLDSFKKRFEEVVSEKISKNQLTPEIKIDAEIDFNEIDYKLYNTLKRMEPFGPNNLRPVFITRNVIPSQYTRLVAEKHIRFSFYANDYPPTFGIGFNMEDKFEFIRPGKPIDIVYSISENDWNNQKSLQLKVIDFRLSNYEVIPTSINEIEKVF